MKKQNLLLVHVLIISACFLALPLICSAQEKIAFVSTRDYYLGEIYTMNPDGSNVTRLTYNTSPKAAPSISRDGRKIVFASGYSLGDSDIYIMNSNGSGLTRLTYDGSTTPEFSFDGSRIVYSCLSAGSYALCVMNADGSGQARK